MEIKVIKTQEDYRKMLERLDVIFDAKIGTPEGDELDVLGLLIDKYENEHFHIDLPDPIEAIKFRMEQLGYKQKELAGIVNSKYHTNEIMNRKRKLSLSMSQQLSSE